MEFLGEKSSLSSPEECEEDSNLSADIHVVLGLPDDRGSQYQRERLHNHYLPYAELLDSDSEEWFQQIKYNLGQAVILRELRPGVLTWISRLTAYVALYGLKFSKEDHVNFILLIWDLLHTKDMEPRLMEVFTRALICLLKKKSLLSPCDLQLPWRPLMDLYDDMTSKHTNMNMKVWPADYEQTLKILIKLSRPYFPSSSADEILAEIRPYFCPNNLIMSEAMSYLALFLPTLNLEQDKEGNLVRPSTPTWSVWLPELQSFWHSCYNSPGWEGSIMTLLSRLCEDNIGEIDWEMETPVLFQRFMASLGLPVFYKRLGVQLKFPVLSTTSISRWVVNTITSTSSTLDHLRIMMGAISSYYHPTSVGHYSDKLVDLLTKFASSFTTRLHKERYETNYSGKPSWIPPIPDKHHLTDEQVEEFCNILKPAVFDLTMSKRHIEQARSILQMMTAIRPDLFLPPLVSRFNLSLETLTEPHKFTAAIKCLSSVSRSLVKPGSLYPEGPSHVVHILMSVLPGIDCNDMKKTMTVFQLISIYARLVPLTDMSNYVSSDMNLTSIEKKICIQSSMFESFVLQFMERCFSLIENSTSENIRQEQATSDTQMSSEESSLNTGITSCFDSILHQADGKIQDVAVRELERFLKGRILEPKIAGKIASGMCRTCAKIAPKKVLPVFIPHVCSALRNCLSEIDLTSDQYPGDEILFNLLLLSDLLCLPGIHLVPYVPQIEQVLHLALQVVNKEGYLLSLSILRHVLHSLSHMCLAERSRIVSSPSSFPLEDWGQSSDLGNLDIKWYIPGIQEFEQLKRLTDIFLGIQVQKLDGFIGGSVNLQKDDLYRCLKTVSSIIIGCSAVLPPWDGEEPVYSNKTKVEYVPRRHITIQPDSSYVYKWKGENTRRFLVQLMQELVDKMFKDREDDTKSLNAIAIILKLVMFQYTVSEESLEKHKTNFAQSKSKLAVRLYGSERHVRAILLDCVLLQHEKRVVESSRVAFSSTHQIVFNLLLRLSTSYYSKVRSQSQTVLTKALKGFPYSYQNISDQVVPLIMDSSKATHEQFKGALYIILQNQFLLKHNWKLQSELWPGIVGAQHSEKPSITALVKTITGHVHSVDNWTINWPSLASVSLNLGKSLCGGSVIPSDQMVSESIEYFKSNGLENQKLYEKVVDRLCDQVDGADLHWRHYNTCLTMLCAMVRHDVDIPIRAVKIFTENLIHDNVTVRKASVHVVDCIMRQNKRKHIKIKIESKTNNEDKNCSKNLDLLKHKIEATNGFHKIGNLAKEFIADTSKGQQRFNRFLVQPGVREDNKFLQYGQQNIPTSEEMYDKTSYIHKTYFGFYVWPIDEIMYAPIVDQPCLDRDLTEMMPSDQVVYQFFMDEAKVGKLVEYFSLENKMGQDHFDVERFGMFKGLFRNFGDSILMNFRQHFERLVKDQRESNQRAASEILAGIIKGSKHWPYSKISSMREWVVPAIKTVLSNVSPETQKDWGACFTTSMDCRDPNRLHWLIEVMMEDPLKSQGSFLDSSRLYMLGRMTQYNWRIGELLRRFLDFLMPFLDHPYQNVRSRLGFVLANIFALDVQYEGCDESSQSHPKVEDFINDVLPKGQLTEGRDSALRLLQTISKWISCSCVAHLGPLKLQMFQFLPMLLGFEWYESDPNLARDCQTALACISRIILHSSTLPGILNILRSCTSSAHSWRTRLASLDFLQAVIFNNFMLFCSPSIPAQTGLCNDVLSLVLESLYDPQIEVRVKSAQVFGGLVHCQFINQKQFPKIICQFREKLNSEMKTVDMTNRHGAVLGLCSFITAFPHSVPSFVPELLVFMGKLLHEKQPIPATIKKSLQSFKRTHQDNWTEHKEVFTEDQLTELTNLLVSPSYYA